MRFGLAVGQASYRHYLAWHHFRLFCRDFGFSFRSYDRSRDAHFCAELRPCNLCLCAGFTGRPVFFPFAQEGGHCPESYLLGISPAHISPVHPPLLYPWHFHAQSDGYRGRCHYQYPCFGAAQTTLHQINPDATAEMAEMALACAVTYPLGVVGVIIALAMLKVMMPKVEERDDSEAPKAFFSEYEICNPALDGKSVREVALLLKRPFVITRVWHNGKVEIPTSDMILYFGDHILAVSGEEDASQLEILFGKREMKDWNRPDIDWNSVDKQLVSRRLVITRPKLNGVRLGMLKIRNLYGVNISRVDRAGVELLPDRDLRLQLGDRLTVVGEGKAVERVAEILGDEVKQLDNPHLTTLFGGLVLGCVFGMIPFYLPGVSMPIKLGLAGGPIIIGILMGAFGPRFHLTTYVTNSANLLLRQFGIILYLGGLGLASGANFFDTIIHGDGLLWVGTGFLITMLPTLLVGWASIKLLRNRYDGTAGMICGSTANPMALDYVNSQLKGDGASVVYATVYPLSMFVRIIFAQIMILIFA